MHHTVMRVAQVPNSAEIIKQRTAQRVAAETARLAAAVAPPIEVKPALTDGVKPFKPMTMQELKDRKKKREQNP